MDVADPNDINILFMKFNRKGRYLAVQSKLTWIPMITQWKLPMELVGVLALAAGAYFMGGYGVQKAWLASSDTNKGSR